MNTEPTSAPQLTPTTLAVTALGATLAAAPATGATVSQLVAEIQSADDIVRGAAWQNAAQFGAPAVQPLAQVLAHPDFEIARAAKRALWKIVRHAGRPKAGTERQAVQAELVPLLQASPVAVRREAVWMLSEIGNAGAVESIARLLTDAGCREDARCALERMPGGAAMRALERALPRTPEDFRPALAHSLRARGRKLKDYPSQKLTPTRQTTARRP